MVLMYYEVLYSCDSEVFHCVYFQMFMPYNDYGIIAAILNFDKYKVTDRIFFLSLTREIILEHIYSL